MSLKSDNTRAKRRYHAKKSGQIPASFVPKFWDDADRRTVIVRKILDRVDKLKRDTGADSRQKQILCERVVFLVTQLETMERTAVESGVLDGGLYVSLANCLSGQLRLLGLERKAKVENLQTYLQKQKEKSSA